MELNVDWISQEGGRESPSIFYKTEAPVEKENINPDIIKFLSSKLTVSNNILAENDFQMEFLSQSNLVAFIKIELKGSDKKTYELKLQGDDAKIFVKLIKTATILSRYSVN